MRIRIALFLSVLPFLFLTASAFFQVDPTDLQAVLLWLATGGGAVIVVNWASSWLVENWVWWHNLRGEVKFVIVNVFALLVAIGAQFLLSQPAIVDQISNYWTLLVTIILYSLGVGTSQFAYALSTHMGYAMSAKAEASKKS